MRLSSHPSHTLTLLLGLAACAVADPPTPDAPAPDVDDPPWTAPLDDSDEPAAPSDSERPDDTDPPTDSDTVQDSEPPTDSDLDGDLDGDGSPDNLDCAPADPLRFPGNPEIPYDTIDQDCSGADLTDLDNDGFHAFEAGGNDCDDQDPNTHPAAADLPYDTIDQDCSGADLTDLDNDGFHAFAAGGTDCDDQDPTTHPAATELPYDTIDQDCSGADLTDLDNDGYPATQAGGTDCDDQDPTTHPAATELPYDTIDQDCSGADLTDLDNDGYPATQAGGSDCDDQDPARNPGTTEVPYDTIDQDCSGADLTDVDNDGFHAPQAGGSDCDDHDPARNPGTTEVPYDTIDQDCSGADLTDVDNDGFHASQAGGRDCDDRNPNRNPAATEVPYDGIDQDCSGADLTDLDNDGYAATQAGGSDCDDRNPNRSPAATEVPYDGIDQDCSGADLTDVDNDGYAAPQAGGTDCDDRNPNRSPAAVEICGNGVDEDCDSSPLVCGWTRNAGAWQADTQLVGDRASQFLGTSLRGGHDVDLDGWPELLIGAPNFASAQSAVYAYTPDPLHTGTRLLPTTTAMFRSEPTRFIGGVIATVDHDADGVYDLVLGATPQSAPPNAQGAVYTVPAGNLGTVDVHDTTVTGGTLFQENPGQQWLGKGAAAGDVLGTGRQVLYLINESTTHAGLIAAFPLAHRPGPIQTSAGPIGGLPRFGTTPDTTLEALAVASGANLGGNAAHELAVALRDHSTGRREVYIVSEPTERAVLDLRAPILPTRVTRVQISSSLGAVAPPTLEMIPTVTGAPSGHDLVIGMSCEHSPCADGGQVWVLPGDFHNWPASMDASHIATQLGGVHLYDNTLGAKLGKSAAAAGDVDGDGHEDLLIGSYQADGDLGAAYLLYGPVPSGSWDVAQVGSRALPGVRIDGVEPSGLFGAAVASLGDVNEDGYADFAVGAPGASNLAGNPFSGRVYLFMGAGD